MFARSILRILGVEYVNAICIIYINIYYIMLLYEIYKSTLNMAILH